MLVRRLQSFALRAFACGSPASTLLFVLDRDRAYSYVVACTVYRVPVFRFLFEL
jgi:hypothetical protein